MYRAGISGHWVRSWGVRFSDLGSKARGRVWGAQPLGAGVGGDRWARAWMDVRGTEPSAGMGVQGNGGYLGPDKGTLGLIRTQGTPNPSAEGVGWGLEAAGVRGLQLKEGRRARLGVALGPDGDARPDRAGGRDRGCGDWIGG